MQGCVQPRAAPNRPPVDRTEEEQERAAKALKKGLSGSHWYLRIRGLQASPTPTDEPTQGELVAFGVWPESPVRITAGTLKDFQAMGVFLDNVFAAEDISGRSTWSASEALKKEGPASFRATRTGTFQVTARIRKGGQWLTDTIEVIVEPAEEE